MNDTGFVYVLINPSMEGLVKVGKTTRDPKERAEELSKATGVPTPFIVAYELAVHDCSRAEAFVHTYLEAKGYRVSSNREFFNAPLNVAIDAILEYKNVDIIDESNGHIDYDDETDFKIEPWEDIERLAYDSLVGNGDTLQDHKEALKLFKQSYRLGSPYACRWIGLMYKIGQGCKSDIERALEYYKEGVKRGIYRCYADMMDIYFNENQFDNAFKCWDMYIETVEDIDSDVCAGYIFAMYKLNLPLKYREKMIDIKEEILNEQVKIIERSNVIFQSENNLALEYMKYVFATDPIEQVMNGQDYAKEYLENRQARQQRRVIMNGLFGLMVLVSFIVALIVSYNFFSSLFIVMIATIAIGVSLLCGLALLYNKYMPGEI